MPVGGKLKKQFKLFVYFTSNRKRKNFKSNFNLNLFILFFFKKKKKQTYKFFKIFLPNFYTKNKIYKNLKFYFFFFFIQTKYKHILKTKNKISNFYKIFFCLKTLIKYFPKKNQGMPVGGNSKTQMNLLVYCP